MFKKAFMIIFLLGLITVFGCVGKKVVYKQYDTTEDWVVKSSITWDSANYATKVSLKYNGKDPLRAVEVRPRFSPEYWPQGYKRPTMNFYTWGSENANGQFPTQEDLSHTFFGKNQDKQFKLLTKKEAEMILNNSEIYIKWTDNNGNESEMLAK